MTQNRTQFINRRLQQDDPAVIAQVVWEHEAVDRGVVRYQMSLLKEHKDGTVSGTALADQEPGMRIVTEVVKNMVPHIVAAQAEAYAGMVEKTNSRHWYRWWSPFLALDAEMIAVITARAAMSMPFVADEANSGRAVQAVAREIGRNMQTQYQFECWKKEQNEKEREARKGGAEGYIPNLWKEMQLKAKDINERVFKSWLKKSEDFRVGEWDREDRTHAGDKALQLLVEQGGGWFEFGHLSMRKVGRYSNEKILKLTDAGLDWVKSKHQKNELNRPWLMPMIQRPLPWVYQSA